MLEVFLITVKYFWFGGEKMPYINVLGHGTFEVEEGKKLMLALKDQGIHILHRCGGQAKCTTCRV